MSSAPEAGQYTEPISVHGGDIGRPLGGRVAIVTGASSGLGARFAAVLAGAGATVVACARRLDRIEQLASEHPGIVAFRCDVTDGADRSAVVERAVALGGKVDILVNNAGIASGGRTEQAQTATLRRVLEVNVEAAFDLCQLAGQRMIAAGSGSIINIGSMFGQVAVSPVADAPYAVSKAAINGLTRELASQWAKDNVRVNAIAPGWFVTEMNSDLLESERGERWLKKQCPMGRAGLEHELDGVLMFLASDASSYCTGQVITVDGGWTLR